MVFSGEDLLLIKVLRQERSYDIDEWSHCFIEDNCEYAWVRIVTETYFWRVIENIMKYDLYGQFLRIFAT